MSLILVQLLCECHAVVIQQHRMVYFCFNSVYVDKYVDICCDVLQVILCLSSKTHHQPLAMWCILTPSHGDNVRFVGPLWKQPPVTFGPCKEFGCKGLVFSSFWFTQTVEQTFTLHLKQQLGLKLVWSWWRHDMAMFYFHYWSYVCKGNSTVL